MENPSIPNDYQYPDLDTKLDDVVHGRYGPITAGPSDLAGPGQSIVPFPIENSTDYDGAATAQSGDGLSVGGLLGTLSPPLDHTTTTLSSQVEACRRTRSSSQVEVVAPNILPFHRCPVAVMCDNDAESIASASDVGSDTSCSATEISAIGRRGLLQLSDAYHTDFPTDRLSRDQIYGGRNKPKEYSGKWAWQADCWQLVQRIGIYSREHCVAVTERWNALMATPPQPLIDKAAKFHSHTGPKFSSEALERSYYSAIRSGRLLRSDFIQDEIDSHGPDISTKVLKSLQARRQQECRWIVVFKDDSEDAMVYDMDTIGDISDEDTAHPNGTIWDAPGCFHTYVARDEIAAYLRARGIREYQFVRGSRKLPPGLAYDGCWFHYVSQPPAARKVGKGHELPSSNAASYTAANFGRFSPQGADVPTAATAQSGDSGGSSDNIIVDDPLAAANKILASVREDVDALDSDVLDLQWLLDSGSGYDLLSRSASSTG